MANLTRTRMERILLLDREIRSGRHPNCSSFARLWRERFGYENPPDRRTILRDIDYLRYMLNAPIAWSNTERGYRYTDPSWILPSLLSVSGPEMLSLLAAWRAAESFRGTPLAELLSGLFDKLAATFTAGSDVTPELAKRKITFLAAPARPVDEAVWRAVWGGLMGRRAQDILYESTRTRKTGRRVIEPWHLVNIGGEWYVTAYCRWRGAIRHFALCGVLEIRDTGDTFPEPEDFDPAHFYSNRFDRFIGDAGGNAFTVVVRFIREAARAATERLWHPQQRITRHRDGGVTLSLPMPSLIEARRWVLSWGADAELLSPQSLRTVIESEILETAQRIGCAPSKRSPSVRGKARREKDE